MQGYCILCLGMNRGKGGNAGHLDSSRLGKVRLHFSLPPSPPRIGNKAFLGRRFLCDRFTPLRRPCSVNSLRCAVEVPAPCVWHRGKRVLFTAVLRRRSPKPVAGNGRARPGLTSFPVRSGRFLFIIRGFGGSAITWAHLCWKGAGETTDTLLALPPMHPSFRPKRCAGPSLPSPPEE